MHRLLGIFILLASSQAWADAKYWADKLKEEKQSYYAKIESEINRMPNLSATDDAASKSAYEKKKQDKQNELKERFRDESVLILAQGICRDPSLTAKEKVQLVSEVSQLHVLRASDYMNLKVLVENSDIKVEANLLTKTFRKKHDAAAVGSLLEQFSINDDKIFTASCEKSHDSYNKDSFSGLAGAFAHEILTIAANADDTPFKKGRLLAGVLDSPQSDLSDRIRKHCKAVFGENSDSKLTALQKSIGSAVDSEAQYRANTAR
ncbi:MAG: hypothetical protein AABZ55_09530 [Bdellovibrionota bacterium]